MTGHAEWHAASQAYFTHLRAGGRSPGTIGQYRHWIGALEAVAADPWSVERDQLVAWLANPDWSPGYRRKGRSAIRGFYAWAVHTGHLQESPAADLPTVLIPRSLPHPAPEDALTAALATADDRTRLMILLAASAGLRAGEIAALHTDQVQPDRLLVVGKGGHHRVVPLVDGALRDELIAELDRRRQGTHGSGWALSPGSGRFVRSDAHLFPNARHPGPMNVSTVKKVVAAALPDGWTAHSLRHRFASRAYAGTRDLLAVQRLLGHALPSSSAGYAAVPDGALSRAVAAAGPARRRS